MYAAPNDSNSHFIGGGMRGKLTAKTAMEARTGVKARSYRLNSANDVVIPVIALSAISAFSERTRLELNIYRNTSESDFINNPYYVADYIGAEIKHTFLKDVVAGVRAQYVNDRFPNEILSGSELRKRNDTRYFAGINCEFPVMEWLSLRESYMYTIRDSNFNQYDYTDHYISMSVRAKY